MNLKTIGSSYPYNIRNRLDQGIETNLLYRYRRRLNESVYRKSVDDIIRLNITLHCSDILNYKPYKL